MNTILRFGVMLAGAVCVAVFSGIAGEWLGRALELDVFAAKWTAVIMCCGAWGWHSDRIYTAAFGEDK